MEVTYVDAKSLKSLDEYAVCLISAILSLKTLESFQTKTIELGILEEDEECRLNTLVWDLRRVMKIYSDQLESVLERLPADFSPQQIIDGLRIQHMKNAKKLTKKPKEKKDEIYNL